MEFIFTRTQMSGSGNMQTYLMIKNKSGLCCSSQTMKAELPFTLNSINPTTNPHKGPLQRYNTKVMRGRFNQETNDGKQVRTVVVTDFKVKLIYSSVLHDYCAIQ